MSRLQNLGMEVRTKETAGDEKYPFVLFAAPPSGSDDYPKEVLIERYLFIKSNCVVC